MAKIYFVRHQAEGLLTEFPFAEPPTDAQFSALAKLCFQRHGEKHRKTGETFWIKTVEVSVLGAGDVPEVPERSLTVASMAGLVPVTVSGKGHVENK